MEESLKIKVTIGGRVYPLKVNSEIEEEGMRKAASKINELVAKIPMGGLIGLAAGGAAYTVGVVFYALHHIPYMHAVWHLFVMGGSLCHYFAVLFYLVPAR